MRPIELFHVVIPRGDSEAGPVWHCYYLSHTDGVAASMAVGVEEEPERVWGFVDGKTPVDICYYINGHQVEIGKAYDKPFETVRAAVAA